MSSNESTGATERKFTPWVPDAAAPKPAPSPAPSPVESPAPATAPPSTKVLPAAPPTTPEQVTAPASEVPPLPTRRRAAIGGLRVLSWHGRAIWLGVVAFAIGVIGELMLFNPASRGQGAILQGGAVVIGVTAWSGARDLPLTGLASTTERGFRVSRQTLLRLAGVALSIVLLLWSFAAFRANPKDVFGLQGVLWLASMVLLVISCAGWKARDGSVAQSGPAWTRPEVALLAGLVLVALVARLAFLYDLPWQIEGNEFTSWREGMNFYTSPPTASMFGTGFLNLGMPNLWFWGQAQFMRLFGPNIVGVRVWNDLHGALLVLPVYGLARLAWGRLAAVLAGAFVAFSSVLVNYSRVAIPNMGTTFWWTLCFFFLLRALKTRRPSDFMWAGLVGGLSQYTYYATRLLPLLVAAYLVYLLIFHFRSTVGLLGGFALMLVAGFVGQGPLTAYFLLNPSTFAGHGASELLIPLAVPTSWDAVVHIWNVVSSETAQNFLALSVIGSRDTFYFAPFFQPVEAVLAILGIGLLIWRWRQPASALMLMWLGSIMLVAAVLYIEANPNPAFNHWAPAWSVYFLALALPPAIWLGNMRRAGKVWWRAGAALVAAGVAVLAFTNAYFYLAIYPQGVPRDNELRAAQGRLLASLDPNTTLARFLGCCWYPIDPEYAHMLAPKLPAGQLVNPARDLPIIGDARHDQAFVTTIEKPQYLPLVQAYYPGGEVVPMRTGDGSAVVTAYKLTAEQVMARYGVKAAFTDESGRVLWEGQVGTIGDLGDLPHKSPSGTVTASWQGLLYVPLAGQLSLHPSVSSAQIMLNGDAYKVGSSVDVAAGWVPFSVRVDLHAPYRFDMPVSGSAGGWSAPTALDTRYLWPQDANAGLAVSQNSPSLPHRIDPVVALDEMRPTPIFVEGNLTTAEANTYFRPTPLLNPEAITTTLITWSGEVNADDGDYTMKLVTDQQSAVEMQIDGASVVTPCMGLGQAVRNTAPVYLSAGWHQVQITLQSNGKGPGLEWAWTRPDKVTEIVPPSRLRYTTGDKPVQWPQVPAPFACKP